MFYQNDNGRYYLLIIPSTHVDANQISTTLVKFGDHVPDTIVLQYELVANRGMATKACINGKAAELGGTSTPFILVK